MHFSTHRGLRYLFLIQGTATKVLSQLKAVVRPMYSSPQLHGARLVSTVLSDPALTRVWEAELKDMSDRIIAMRSALVQVVAWVFMRCGLFMLLLCGSLMPCDLSMPCHLFMHCDCRCQLPSTRRAVWLFLIPFSPLFSPTFYPCVRARA